MAAKHPNNNTNPHEVFGDFVDAISESELGNLLPLPLRQFVVESRGQNNLFWSMTGDGVKGSNH